MTDTYASAKADYDDALAAYRTAQARLVAAKAALKPFLDVESAAAEAKRLRNAAAAVAAWLNGATEKEAAVIAGYKSATGFDSVKYRMIRRYAPETFGTAYDEVHANGAEFSYEKAREVERRHATIALKRYNDAHAR